MNQQMKKIDRDEATLALAASAVDRTNELLQDGWMQKDLRTKIDDQFCIHGALHLALEEIFGHTQECGRYNICAGMAANRHGRGPVEAIATAYIVDAAADLYGYDRDAWRAGRMGAAEFNDQEGQTVEKVLTVVRTAADRLWETVMGDLEQARSWAAEEQESQAGVYVTV